jgi:uncharacterized protein
MKKVTLLFFLFPFIVCAQTTENFVSKKTGDSYDLVIRKPKDYDSSKSYHIVYFPDATINSGKEILALDEAIVKNCILVGLGHKENWNMKRQRDFIPSDAGGYSNAEFGQAAKFYQLMKDELIPLINKRFKKQKSRVFIGHSFGGLVAIYMSMKDNKLFNHYYAISPSVWANHGELMKIEKRYAGANRSYNSNISLYAGSLEFLNKVLSSTREFYNTVNGRKYKGLSINFEVVAGVNHYGIIGKVVPEIFRALNRDPSLRSG